MMNKQKVLLTLSQNDISPRFDLTREVLIVELGEDGNMESRKTMVLPHCSVDDLCHLILAQNISVVICGGIEEEYYQYLTWKKVQVIDSVMAPCDLALERFMAGALDSPSILYNDSGRDRDGA